VDCSRLNLHSQDFKISTFSLLQDQTRPFNGRAFAGKTEGKPQRVCGDAGKRSDLQMDRPDPFPSVPRQFFFRDLDDIQRDGEFMHSYMVLIRIYRRIALKFIAAPTAMAARIAPLMTFHFEFMLFLLVLFSL
jgi:hypothetical protein